MLFLGGLGVRLELVLGLELGSGFGARVSFRVRENKILNELNYVSPRG